MTDTQDKVFFKTTQPHRALYLNALKARGAKLKNGKESEPKFDATLMIASDSPDYAGLRSAILAAAAQKWPGRNVGSDIKAGQFNIPITDGDRHADKEKAKGKDRETARGSKLVKASSKFQPTLCVIANGAVVDLTTPELVTMHEKKFYPGVQVAVEIELVPYEAVRDGENDGVSARLYKVLSLNKGDRLGGSVRTGAEVFKEYAGMVSDEDPTGGDLDDEIPF